MVERNEEHVSLVKGTLLDSPCVLMQSNTGHYWLCTELAFLIELFKTLSLLQIALFSLWIIL